MIQTYEEKESDVRIATQIVNDANNHLCDVAIVVSAESPETEAPVSDTNTLIAAVERNLAKMDALNTDYSLFRGITCGVLSSTTPAYGHPFYIEGELSATRAAGGRARLPQSPYCGVTLCRLVRG